MSDWILPPLSELLSPVEYEALANECENNEDIYALLEAWGDPDKREEMQEWAIDFLVRQAEYQISDENTLYIAIYGPKGKGKSEIAQRLAFFLIGVYQENEVQVLDTPKIARSPSEANDIFAEETVKGNSIFLILDEKERQVSTASKANLDALLQNVDTMRSLRHSLIMIAITKKEFGKLLSRSEIVFRAIFKDRDNQVNWCIMYVNDMEAKKLLPMAIVGIELHPHDDFRQLYKEDKHSRQVRLTGRYGRSVADPKNVIETTKRVMAYLKKHRMPTPKATTIRELLLTEIPNTLIGEEKDAVISRVIRLRKKRDAKKLDTEMVWVGDTFDWRIRISSTLKDETTFPEEYWKIWYVTEVECLTLHMDRDKVKEIIGMTYGSARKWKKRMDKDTSFQGWIKYTRGEMFEDFLKKRFETLGYEVKKKPKVVVDGKEYEEDLLIHRDGQKLFINAKCGTGYANYIVDNYKTTHLIKTSLQMPAWIVYYDYAVGIYSIHDPAKDHFNVGSEETSTLIPFETAEIAKGAKLGKADAEKVHSTPLFLSALLNNIVTLGLSDT